MPTDEEKREIRRDKGLAAVLLAAGVLMAGISLAMLIALFHRARAAQEFLQLLMLDVVNQRHFDAVAKRLREHGAEFEPAEAGAENEDAFFH